MNKRIIVETEYTVCDECGSRKLKVVRYDGLLSKIVCNDCDADLVIEREESSFTIKEVKR